MKLFPCARVASIATFVVSFSFPVFSASSVEAPGVTNFHQINDRVYRGAQPTAEGFASLAKLGVKTIVDLRGKDERREVERQIVEADGMKYVNLPMKGMTTPADEQVAKALALLEDSSAGPVFVHCQRGADRTGAVMAIYRIEHDHWSNSDALKEAKSFGMSPFQRAIEHYVLRFQPAQLSAWIVAPTIQ
ncbi:MAG: tyrosine-protein phosphatase [Bryobacterales bacterium]|nr:tyrosine-protein phosphatase [Bryobacterales bacterium]MBV9400591.1 tyrosine-protein phosphatase [Bryobacterales bacterium]